MVPVSKSASGVPCGFPFEIGGRILVVAAHPDDETIWLGSLLARLAGLVIAHVTDGSPRNFLDAQRAGFATGDGYARKRRDEVRHALEMARRPRTPIVRLDLVDQEAARELTWLTRRLMALIRATRPGLVITHPYEGGHPDHDATAFAVQAAMRVLGRRGERLPRVVEAASYHASPGGMLTGRFLPRAGVPEWSRALSPEEREAKDILLGCFGTQREVLRQFSTSSERFRIAPAYDFTRPPHPGSLLYERFDWGIDGPAFRALAREASIELGLE